jgi:hypothetical protein
LFSVRFAGSSEQNTGAKMDTQKYLLSDEFKIHHVKSASACFQKGIYHLYVWKNNSGFDAFDRVIRVYQSVFLLGVTQWLLDLTSNFQYQLDRAATVLLKIRQLL